MKPGEKTTARIQFCDEYEKLLEEFLRALATWNQLRAFGSQGETLEETRAAVELTRVGPRYAAAAFALRRHSRECLVCEETLRVQVNRGGASAATLPAS
jgi:hypothetical protein